MKLKTLYKTQKVPAFHCQDTISSPVVDWAANHLGLM